MSFGIADISTWLREVAQLDAANLDAAWLILDVATGSYE